MDGDVRSRHLEHLRSVRERLIKKYNTLSYSFFSYGSEDFCYKQLDSLIGLLGKIRGDRLENVFLRHVVSRLFSFLTETYRRKLLRSRPLHRNIKLWSTLGAFDVPNNEIVEAIAGRVNKVVAKTCTVDDFNEMVTRVISLKRWIFGFLFQCDYLELSKGDRSTVPICELWGLSGSEDVSKSTWFQKFIRTLISATKNTITAFDTKQLQQVRIDDEKKTVIRFFKRSRYWKTFCSSEPRARK